MRGTIKATSTTANVQTAIALADVGAVVVSASRRMATVMTMMTMTMKMIVVEMMMMMAWLQNRRQWLSSEPLGVISPFRVQTQTSHQ